MEWYTRETGSVRGSPDYRVHFGINSLGLVNAYAKDVAFLPEWLQRVWAGFNVSPEGKVSAELFSAQGQGVPARDASAGVFPSCWRCSPERRLHQAFRQSVVSPAHRPREVFKSCHRFKALSASGLYGLAKDLVRVVVEHIDTAALHKIVSPPDKENWGPLKSLEKVLATVTGEKWAHAALGPLHGIYSLRLADAHVPVRT